MRRNSSYLLFALCVLLVGAAGCGTKYPACKGDKDCKAKEYCVNQKCQQCRNTADCAAGEKCNAGRCDVASNKCSSDFDCPADQSCIDGACKACASDDECGTGGKCNAGRCQRASSGSNIQSSTPDSADSGACKLEAVYFDFNESALSGEASSLIDKNGECIKKNGARSVTLTGFADPRGTEEFNLALSERRAQSVRDRLVRMGVDGQKMRVVPKGEVEATGNDDAGWAKDRRVEFKQ